MSPFWKRKRPASRAGNHPYAIGLLDEEYWEIDDVETSGGRDAGIFIGCTKDDLELNHVRITNCYVHDMGDSSKIDWEYSRSTGGIINIPASLPPLVSTSSISQYSS